MVSYPYRYHYDCVHSYSFPSVHTGGKFVALVGRTGSGKSSLLGCVAGLYCDVSEGLLAIDDIDVGKIDMRLLRSKVIMLSQEPFILDADVRANLDPYGQFRDNELKKVASSSPYLIDFSA